MKMVHILCDACGKEGAINKTGQLARRMIRKFGWIHHSAVDLCPQCRQKFYIHREHGLTGRTPGLTPGNDRLKYSEVGVDE